MADFLFDVHERYELFFQLVDHIDIRVRSNEDAGLSLLLVFDLWVEIEETYPIDFFNLENLKVLFKNSFLFFLKLKNAFTSILTLIFKNLAGDLLASLRIFVILKIGKDIFYLDYITHE